MGNNKNENHFLWIMRMTVGTFFLAFIFGFMTQLLFQKEIALLPAFLILLVVILIGVFFDTIGTAAAAASISPLNAKAARKVVGARKGVDLVRNADRVANFCNDVVGDITGIISGGIATLIIFRLLFFSEGAEFYLRMILTALVAAITVGGKAWGKYKALRHSTEIMLKIGLILTKFESLHPGRRRAHLKNNEKKGND